MIHIPRGAFPLRRECIQILRASGNKDYYTDDGYYVYDYHSIILGYLLRLNFHNKVSLGIGGGILIPLYSTANQADYSFGLIDNYQYMTEFNQKNIAFMYKLPFMPYILCQCLRII
mgnify:CR=1 FL=1